LLPNDTLLLGPPSDFHKLSEIYRQSPPARFLNDPAMKPFTDKFISKWKEEFLKAAPARAGCRFRQFRQACCKAKQLFAVTQTAGTARTDQAPGLLLLLDTRDKSLQLKKPISFQFRRNGWTPQEIRVEKIRDVEFLFLTMSQQRLFPPGRSKSFPTARGSQEWGPEPKPEFAPDTELVLGQAWSRCSCWGIPRGSWRKWVPNSPAARLQRWAS